ncbi:hypothetical protein K432DRAFT_41740 [Lepidopterella palustris CBS 459.81]|uniref:Uncharacterized protein n=1 Tax=Lepidopterella palustris CBS 459.81 TaxID=1314670 RepID=A0A8E2EAR6_9PEZI|nr:hypothetical protein K432DRAFT_41740 [Lepidopterella palustris CBS 459.81]
MATAETVTLSEPHAPKPASVKAFESILPSLKHELVKLRRNHDKHEPEYFKLVSKLSDHELTSITLPDDLELVRVGSSAYGLHLFGKLRIPAAEGAYIHVRVFVAAEEGTDGKAEENRVAKLHSINTEETVKENGDHVFKAIFGKEDPLEWFEI